MRNWGIVITAFYTVVLLLLSSYGVVVIAEAGSGLSSLPESAGELMEFFISGQWWPILILVCGQALLLFLSVDSSWRRIRPRQHVMVTAGLVGFMVALLTLAGLFAIGVAAQGDDFLTLKPNPPFDSAPEKWGALPIFGTLLLLWGAWGLLFFAFAKRASNIVDSAVGWLLKGSVLELLVALPCHIIVRQREDCSAPYISAFGIATGIAIMLMAFGPSALYLYKRKLDDYTRRPAQGSPAPD